MLSKDFLAVVEKTFPKGFSVTPDTDSHLLKEYGADRTKAIEGCPSMAVFPRSTEEVARFLRLCAEHSIALVPSGGRTGLSGGAAAPKGEVVLSLEKMTGMEPVNTLARTVRVQAGVVTEILHAHCEPHGLTWPVDFAAKGSSQIGGNISTNAGGVRVIRYGTTRQWVLGLQVVTPAGDVLECNGALEKNNTGLDLKQLYIGTEGTLGIITEAVLKLAPLPEKTELFMFAVPDMKAALALLEESRTNGPFVLQAFEFMSGNSLDCVCRLHDLTKPFVSEAYVLMEVENGGPEILEEWLKGIFEKGLVQNGVQAQSSKDRKNFWALRENINESLAETGVVHKNDVSVEVPLLGKFLTALEKAMHKAYPSYGIYVFGHLGDGNLHVDIMKPEDMDKEAFLSECHMADDVIFSVVQKYKGSISAEHGVGLIKRDFLHYSHTPQELAVLKGIKKELDPKGILNPGKILSV